MGLAQAESDPGSCWPGVSKAGSSHLLGAAMRSGKAELEKEGGVLLKFVTSVWSSSEEPSPRVLEGPPSPGCSVPSASIPCALPEGRIHPGFARVEDLGAFTYFSSVLAGL